MHKAVSIILTLDCIGSWLQHALQMGKNFKLFQLLLYSCSLIFTDSEDKLIFVFFAQICHKKSVKKISFSTSELGS